MAIQLKLIESNLDETIGKPDLRRWVRRSGFVLRTVLPEAAYLTTDWKSGEVRRLANWLSEEE